MKAYNRVDVAIVVAIACVAGLAMVIPGLQISSSLRLVAAVGGILLGPGILAYRLATGSRWGECLVVGIGVNLAILMLLGLFAVTIHFWHPLWLEFLIPLTTLLLSIVLLQRKERVGDSGTPESCE